MGCLTLDFGLGPGFPLGFASTNFAAGFGPGFALGLVPGFDLEVGAVDVVAEGFGPGFALSLGPGFPFGFTADDDGIFAAF